MSTRTLEINMVSPEFTWQWCLTHLEERINSVDWTEAREDVRRFVKATEYPSLELWSRELFLSQLQKIKG
jgi:hypothetical protein